MLIKTCLPPTAGKFFCNYIFYYPKYIFFKSINHIRKGRGAMSKLKIVEIAVLAINALLVAVRSVIKFIEYMSKLKAQRARGVA